MRLLPHKPHRCAATDRARQLAVELQAKAAGGSQYVLIGHVLRALDPGYQPPPEPPRDPREDPLTGCLPVTAETRHAGPG
jgi:hypothetical protein